MQIEEFVVQFIAKGADKIHNLFSFKKEKEEANELDKLLKKLFDGYNRNGKFEKKDTDKLRKLFQNTGKEGTKQAGKTGNAFRGMWKQITLGAIATDTLRRAFSGVTGSLSNMMKPLDRVSSGFASIFDISSSSQSLLGTMAKVASTFGTDVGEVRGRASALDIYGKGEGDVVGAKEAWNSLQASYLKSNPEYWEKSRQVTDATWGKFNLFDGESQEQFLMRLQRFLRTNGMGDELSTRDSVKRVLQATGQGAYSDVMFSKRNRNGMSELQYTLQKRMGASDNAQNGAYRIATAWNEFQEKVTMASDKWLEAFAPITEKFISKAGGFVEWFGKFIEPAKEKASQWIDTLFSSQFAEDCNKRFQMFKEWFAGIKWEEVNRNVVNFGKGLYDLLLGVRKFAAKVGLLGEESEWQVTVDEAKRNGGHTDNWMSGATDLHDHWAGAFKDLENDEKFGKGVEGSLYESVKKSAEGGTLPSADAVNQAREFLKTRGYGPYPEQADVEELLMRMLAQFNNRIEELDNSMYWSAQNLNLFNLGHGIAEARKTSWKYNEYADAARQSYLNAQKQGPHIRTREVGVIEKFRTWVDKTFRKAEDKRVPVEQILRIRKMLGERETGDDYFGFQGKLEKLEKLQVPYLNSGQNAVLSSAYQPEAKYVPPSTTTNNRQVNNVTASLSATFNGVESTPIDALQGYVNGDFTDSLHHIIPDLANA